MARKQQRSSPLCWGSICWSDLVCFIRRARSRNKNKTRENEKERTRGNCRVRREEDKGQGGTFGLWGSLAGPPSSFTSAFAFPSGLIIPSPDIPMAPSPREETFTEKYWVFQRIKTLCVRYLWAGSFVPFGRKINIYVFLFIKRFVPTGVLSPQQNEEVRSARFAITIDKICGPGSTQVTDMMTRRTRLCSIYVSSLAFECRCQYFTPYNKNDKKCVFFVLFG